MCNENGEKDLKCSFFNGSEAISHVLPKHIFDKYNNLLEASGNPIIVTVKIPFDTTFMENDSLKSIPLKFFCLWFNNIILDQNTFQNECGYNIIQDVSPELILNIE